MSKRKWKTPVSFLALALLSLGAFSAGVRADEALARLLDGVAGRFFLSQSAEGTEIASRVIGHRIRTQADFEALVSRATGDGISGDDARVLRRQIRKLDHDLGDGSEDLSNDQAFDRLRSIARDRGMDLNSNPSRGRMNFFPDHAAEGSFEANTDAFLNSGADAPGLRDGRRSDLATFDFDERATIAAGDRAKAARLARKYGVTGFSGDNYADLVGEVYGKLRVAPNASRETALAAADRMASFGEELEKLISRLPEDAKRGVRYTVADGVLSLESFKDSDFSRVDQLSVNNPQVRVVHLSEYPENVRGFVDNTGLFAQDRAFSRSVGVLTGSDIRDMAALNMWPMDLQPHDFRHVHFALSHPRAAAVYFKSARSMDPLRFTMVSAMYEGVDTVQYWHESSLARYMDQTMHLNLEDAMIYLAKASHAELLEVARGSGSYDGIMSWSEQFASWTPRYPSGYSPRGRAGRGLDADIDDMMNQFRTFARSRGNARYLRYDHQAVQGQAPERGDDAIQYPGRGY